MRTAKYKAIQKVKQVQSSTYEEHIKFLNQISTNSCSSKDWEYAYMAAKIRWELLLAKRYDDDKNYALWEKCCKPGVYKKDGKFFEYEKFIFIKEGVTTRHWHPAHVVFDYAKWLDEFPSWMNLMSEQRRGIMAQRKTKRSRVRSIGPGPHSPKK